MDHLEFVAAAEVYDLTAEQELVHRHPPFDDILEARHRALPELAVDILDPGRVVAVGGNSQPTSSRTYSAPPM